MTKTTQKNELDRGVRAWERQSWEPAKVYASFLQYRDLGKQRNPTAFRKRYGHDVKSYIERYKWPERLLAWDRYRGAAITEVVLEKAVESVAELSERRRAIVKGAQSLVAMELEKLLLMSRDSAAPVLGPDELRQWAKWSQESERLEYGLANSVVETRVVGPSEEVVEAVKDAPEQVRSALAKYLSKL